MCELPLEPAIEQQYGHYQFQVNNPLTQLTGPCSCQVLSDTKQHITSNLNTRKEPYEFEKPGKLLETPGVDAQPGCIE